MNFQKGGRLFTFFCLYITQSIPMSFFSTVLPVIMRQQNFSLELIGLLQFLKFPWIVKFLWSPVVDRTSIRLNHYKRWIFSSETIYAAIILGVSFLDFQVTPVLIIGLIFCSFIASATQDIATDALAVVSFNRKDKSLVNSMQSMGSFGGAMIGGGLLLLLYNRLGWGTLLPFLALFTILSLIPLVFFKERHMEEEPLFEKKLKRMHPDDLLGFFKQKGIRKQIIFLLLYYSGLIGILAMIKPMLVDHGYGTKEIGLMSGVIGSSVGCAASFGAGFIVRRIGLYASRVLFAGLTLAGALFFYCLATFLPVNMTTLYLAITLLWASYGMSAIIVYTSSMDCVRKGYEGTDFTIQTVITHLSSMVVAVLSGKLAGSLGYNNLFLVETGIAVVSLVYVIIAFDARRISSALKSTRSIAE